MAIKRNLICCCCGNDAGRFQQHWNRDTGFGICRKCIDWLLTRGTPPEEISEDYGNEGINYASSAENEVNNLRKGALALADGEEVEL